MDFSTTIDKAQKQGLCPNRIWGAGARLNNWSVRVQAPLRNFCETIPDAAISHENHSKCSLQYCEFSSWDFTAIRQYHEPYTYELGDQSAVAKHHENPNVCFAIRGLFDDRMLVKAINSGQLTAWQLDGSAILEHPRPFMAVSHVWSDGTGQGKWPSKQVNVCLFTYFRDIARRFSCDGIWWDTLCIPEDREARNRSLATMDLNYAYARLTLVHDRFLRNVPFKDPDTACFAIIMSAWFTRGWTALELVRSRKVIVVFKNVMKDLDHDILDKVAKQNIAATILQSLRNAQISGIDDLINILGPRSTSWPKDRAIIASLLTGIPVNPFQDDNTFQQDIFQSILRVFGKVSHEHLHHKSDTMSGGFGWCPTSLFDLPPTDLKPTLVVDHDGEIVGKWEVVALDDELCEQIRDKGHWDDLPDFLKEKSLPAIMEAGHKHLLLVTPRTMKKEEEDMDIKKGVVVQVMRRLCNGGIVSKCHYAGALKFQPALKGRRGSLREIAIGDTDGWDELQESETASQVILGDSNERQDRVEESRECDVTNADERGLSPTREAAAASRAVSKSMQFRQHGILFDAECKWTEAHSAAWSGSCLESIDRNLTDRLGQEVIHLAAERRRTSIVGRILQTCGEDPSVLKLQDANGQTPLHRAAWGGSRDIVRSILKHGSPLNVQDRYGNTALHLAADIGSEEVVRCLCDHADVNQAQSFVRLKRCGGLTALHCAALSGHYEVARVLVEHGALVDGSDDISGCTPLHYAADVGSLAMVQMLINQGADTARKNVMGWTAVHIAAIQGNSAIVGFLLQRKPQLGRERDANGWSPMDFAAINGHKPVVLVLSNFGITLTLGSWAPLEGLSRTRDAETEKPLGAPALETVARWRTLTKLLGPVSEENGKRDVVDGTRFVWSRMHLAAVDGRPGLITRLLAASGEKGELQGQLQVPIDNRSSLLYWAARNALFGTLSLFLQLEVDLEIRCQGETPLWAAAMECHENIVRLLLENGAKAEATNNQRMTILTAAAQQGKVELVKLLLKTGKVKPDAHDGKASYCTPISYAIEEGHEEVVRILLDTGGIDLSPEGKFMGRAPLLEAVYAGRASIVKLLFEKGGNIGINGVNSDQTPLLEAVRRGNLGMVKLLLDHRPMPRLQDPRSAGRHPLSYAAERGDWEIVRLLLQAGTGEMKYARGGNHSAAGFNRACRSREWSPLFYAVANGHVEVVRLLLGEENLNIGPSDKFWRTPLYYAAEGGHEAIVSLLLDAGDDSIDFSDVQGKTPRSIARDQGHHRIEELFNSRRQRRWWRRLCGKH